MKKILMSMLTIALVGALITGGAIAYFSDVEKSNSNVFEAGTIDIAIDGENPWSANYSIRDMKPCETGYITFVITNEGTNPVVVWKHITDVDTGGGDSTYLDICSSEPEYVEGGGTFPGPDDYEEKHDIDTVIEYDLSVLVNVGTAGWWQTIYDHDVTIRQITSKNVLLGMIPVDGEMVVTQSYHMKMNTGNWAQGDTMDFKIEIIGEQQMGSLLLENKTGDPKWDIIQGDGIKADLTYNTMGPTFDYTLDAKGLTPGNYSLIYYADPWPGTGGCLIDTMTADGTGKINKTASVDLAMDLPSSPDDNFPGGAKVWLVLSSDYDGTKMTAWNPSSYLFETALMTYDDTD